MFGIIDCNNFYASCERLFVPKLAKEPVVVLSNNDGCVIARSEEAKALGIKMGAVAHEIEDTIQKYSVKVFSSNYALYGDISNRVMEVIKSLAPAIEVYSIDEAFVDLSDMPYHDLEGFVHSIRQTILQYVGIPVSIGVARTKTLAKIANRFVKKHLREKGVCVLDNPVDIQIALQATKVEDIWGVGYQYSKILTELSIFNALQFSLLNPNWVKKKMTIQGLRTLRELNEFPCLTLELQPEPKKAILNSRSFGKSQKDKVIISEAVSTFAARCAEKLRKQKSSANLLNVFLYTNRFRNEPQYNISRTIEIENATNDTGDLIGAALRVLDIIYKPGFNYKKCGVMVSGIVPEDFVQTNLFFEIDLEVGKKNREIMRRMDEYNKKVGRDTIRMAAMGFGREWKLRQEYKSPRYTTVLGEILTINND
ncbi:Y-family DNA polymerase [Emticicia sp. BO119]|uniref:Y-family DNA polymerase n=1 Tax=Emticicia sp. BO119 TaxID=2757768 RepID=UPI0015F020D8|nr:Y-family DNA polymerase [Emticicia sp. BO119]MBA4852096.1 Y-family DNA polymerase [Emticicia sp. BO119]